MCVCVCVCVCVRLPVTFMAVLSVVKVRLRVPETEIDPQAELSGWTCGSCCFSQGQGGIQISIY